MRQAKTRDRKLPRLPNMPPLVSRLPRSEEPGPAYGYPIPWFVGLSPATGKPDFRCIRERGRELAVERGICWICGTRTKRTEASFTIGPMCMANRITSEPPAHLDCARFAARVCPFLADPRRGRRPFKLGEDEVALPPPGMHSPDNPGAAVVWTTDHASFDGSFFTIGDPIIPVEIYAKGRRATPEEAHEAFERGLTRLAKVAAAQGPAAFSALVEAATAGRKLLPRIARPLSPAEILEAAS